MDILSSEELLEHIDGIIEYLSDNEDLFYIAVEVARQLRDEVVQVMPDDQPDD